MHASKSNNLIDGRLSGFEFRLIPGLLVLDPISSPYVEPLSCQMDRTRVISAACHIIVICFINSSNRYPKQKINVPVLSVSHRIG